ncbi:hypothetical protein J6590_093150 [Homalodisca vitripennis]|nr:hypothetical protein J6590_093150 [Homalodisca vitripennis]
MLDDHICIDGVLPLRWTAGPAPMLYGPQQGRIESKGKWEEGFSLQLLPLLSSEVSYGCQIMRDCGDIMFYCVELTSRVAVGVRLLPVRALCQSRFMRL